MSGRGVFTEDASRLDWGGMGGGCMGGWGVLEERPAISKCCRFSGRVAELSAFSLNFTRKFMFHQVG